MKKVYFLFILLVLFPITSLSGNKKILNIHRFSIYLSNGISSKKACTIKSGKYEWKKDGILIKEFNCSTKMLGTINKINIYNEIKNIQNDGYDVFIHNNLIEGKIKKNKKDLSFNIVLQ